jgi:hypothetical protein
LWRALFHPEPPWPIDGPYCLRRVIEGATFAEAVAERETQNREREAAWRNGERMS